MRVAAQLDIPFITLDLEAEYKKDVIEYMISEYSIGRVPNPDVMCNKYVKFGGFLKFAEDSGADYIATGHYTQNIYNQEKNTYEVFSGVDSNKDQSYFLWTLKREKLQKVLFPVGGIPKDEVRKIAKEAGLCNADKKDSQGLCFIGKLDIKEFLKEYIKVFPGTVLDTSGEIIGTHDGALLYTLGERHGFTITKKTPGDKPLFIISKDVTANTITVSESPLQQQDIQTLTLTDCNWITDDLVVGNSCEILVRYRGSALQATCTHVSPTTAEFRVESNQTLGASGQSAVIYNGQKMLGGGIIA
jgi:tRNA-specific 2-thiouridylase